MFLPTPDDLFMFVSLFLGVGDVLFMRRSKNQNSTFNYSFNLFIFKQQKKANFFVQQLFDLTYEISLTYLACSRHHSFFMYLSCSACVLSLKSCVLSATFCCISCFLSATFCCISCFLSATFCCISTFFTL